MPNCYRCGQPVEIRVYDGRPIPFHLYGSCSAVSSSWSGYGGFAGRLNINEPPSIYRLSHWSDDVCYPSHCPECGDDVFFIRYNGGSVWVDPPLGWPWPKHGCMYDRSGPADFAAIFKVGQSYLKTVDDSNGLGVVGNVAVYLQRHFSILQIHYANGQIRLVGMDGLHNDLMGEVVFLFTHYGRLYLITADGLKLFAIDDVKNPFK